MHQFDEHHAELKGFSSYFNEEIFPLLAAQERSRKEVLRKNQKCGVIIAVLAVAIALYSFIVLDNVRLLVFALIGGVFAYLGLESWFMKPIRSQTKEKIVGSICNYVGLTFQSKVTESPDLELLEIYGLVPKGYREKNSEALISVDLNAHKRATFEDQMSGEAHGAHFKSVEIHLERSSDDKWVTVLRGQVMTLTFPRKFLGQTVVLRDKGMFQRKKHGDMKRVGLVDPVFEKIFEAYSTDQVESRYLLDPAFMQKLVDLERSVDGKRIRFGFIEGQLLIVVETKNRYEAGSMFKPLTSPERTQKILDEVGAIYDIVDAVLAPNA